ncbi:formate dehydrogenase subunit delta [Halomonas organivorans]
MTLDQDAQLVRMVNQIAANLGGGREPGEAADGVCAHLEKFWARPMKRRVIACLDEADNGLAPLARQAVERLAERQTG